MSRDSTKKIFTLVNYFLVRHHLNCIALTLNP